MTIVNARIADEARRLAEAREAAENKQLEPQAQAFLRDLARGPIRFQTTGAKHAH